VKSVNQH